MATTNFDRYDVGDNVREDLSDTITNIAPTETPFTSIICGRGPAAESTYVEWVIDDLDTVVTNNARVDGAPAGNDTSSKGTRVGNYCQISDKVIKISGRADAVRKAGRKQELGYQLIKAGKKLKRDMEAILTSNQASAAGDSSTASTAGSLRAWLATNDDLGAAPGASGGFSGGTVSAATDGVTRALSEADLLTIVKQCYEQGGEPDTIMVSPSVKQKLSSYLFSSTARIATPYNDARGEEQAMSAIAAIDVYVSDFGKLVIRPNRFQRDRDVFVLDSNLWQLSYLRPMKVNKLAKTGDAENRQLIVDYTLRSLNEAGSGVVADVDHTAAVTA